MSMDSRYSSGNWRGRIAADWREELQDFDLWSLEHAGEIVVSYRSRKVSRVHTPKGTLYVKTIWGLTDPGMTGKDPLSFLKWVFRPSRALAAWRVSQRLLEAGFLCARPVLAIRRRSSLGYPTDIFISEEIAAPLLSDMLPGMSVEEQADLAILLGRELRKFHAAGFVHGDCILRNICLTSDKKLVYLDNDRSKVKGVTTIFSRSVRNLAQIGYSARRGGAKEEFPVRLFEEYARQAGWSAAQSQKLVKRLCAGIEKRLQKRLKRQPQPTER
jgi:tRNA A-37 threonylcarbamoyl transferase component Bud32